jgi:hypothetical protein
MCSPRTIPWTTLKVKVASCFGMLVYIHIHTYIHTHTHTHSHQHARRYIREVVNLEERIFQIRDIPEQMIPPHQLCYANLKSRLKFHKQHCEQQEPRLPQLLALFHKELKAVTPNNGTHLIKPSLTTGLKYPG